MWGLFELFLKRISGGLVLIVFIVFYFVSVGMFPLFPRACAYEMDETDELKNGGGGHAKARPNGADALREIRKNTSADA